MVALIALALVVVADGVEVGLRCFQSVFGVSDVRTEVGIASFCVAKSSIGISILVSKSIVVTVEHCVFILQLRVLISGHCQLTLRVLKSLLLVGKVVRASVNKLAQVPNLMFTPRHFTVECLLLFSLLTGLNLLGVIGVMEAGQFTPQLRSLVLHNVDLGGDLIEASLLIVEFVAAHPRLLFKLVSFKDFLIVESPGSDEVIGQTLTNPALFANEVLQLVKRPACLSDFLALAVQLATRVMLHSCLLVAEESEAILSVEYLIVDTSVVATLVAKVVELLPQLSDELVLLAGPNLNSRVGAIVVVCHEVVF